MWVKFISNESYFDDTGQSIGESWRSKDLGNT